MQALATPLQWIFDRSEASGLASGQYLAVSLSAADAYVGVSSAELQRVFLPEFERLFPGGEAGTAREVLRDLRAQGDLSAGARHICAIARERGPSCRASTWRAPGPTRAGPPRWKGAVLSGESCRAARNGESLAADCRGSAEVAA